jgi:hypothetical protein
MKKEWVIGMRKVMSLLLVLWFAIVPFEKGLAEEGSYVLTESSLEGASYEDSRLINSTMLKGYLQIEEFDQQFINWIQQENAFCSQRRALVKQRNIECERMNVIQYGIFYINSINQERAILDRWSTIVNQSKSSINQFVEVSNRRLELLRKNELSKSERHLIKVFKVHMALAINDVDRCEASLKKDYRQLVSGSIDFAIDFIYSTVIFCVGGMIVYNAYKIHKLNKELDKKMCELREKIAEETRLENYSLWKKVCGWILHKDNGEFND